jgi:hypothetical protein
LPPLIWIMAGSRPVAAENRNGKESEMSGLSVYDVKSREKWQELLDEMERELGMFCAILDADHQLQQSSGGRNDLCLEIQGRESVRPVICGQSQGYIAGLARSGKTSVVEICEAGMAKLVVPIFSNGDYLGCFTSCGALLPGDAVETFFIDKTAGLGEETIEKLAETAPVVGKEGLERAGQDLFRRLNEPG